jgi:hypothetical protein
MSDARNIHKDLIDASLRYFVDVNCRVNKENFCKILENFRTTKTQVKHIFPPAVIEQAYEDYLTICKEFDNKNIRITSLLFSFANNEDKSYDYDCVISGNLQKKIINLHIALNQKSFLKNALGDRDKAALASVSEFQALAQRLHSEGFITVICQQVSNELLRAIANSDIPGALRYINLGVALNKYSLTYGNTPLLLAVSKGWPHADTVISQIDNSQFNSIQINTEMQQKNVIIALIKQATIEVNCKHLWNGMTPLHIACLRGDTPLLIQLLLDKGADPKAQDASGKTPFQYLDSDYNEAKKQIILLTGDLFQNFSAIVSEAPPEHILFTATLPTRVERNRNIQEIKTLLKKNPSDSLTANKNTGNQPAFFSFQKKSEDEMIIPVPVNIKPQPF